MADHNDHVIQAQNVTSIYFEILQQLNMSTAPEWLQLNLTLQQMKVLYLLKHNGTLKMKELHEKLGVSMPTITGIVNRLIERRDGVPLIARETSPEDRREVWARLTTAGLETTDNLNELNVRLIEKAMARLDKHDLADLKDGLQHFLNAVIEQRHEMSGDKDRDKETDGRPHQERPIRMRRNYTIRSTASTRTYEAGNREAETVSLHRFDLYKNASSSHNDS